MRSLAFLLLVSALLSGCSDPDPSTPASNNLPAGPVRDEGASSLSAGDGRNLTVLPIEEDGILAPAAGLAKGGMVGLFPYPLNQLYPYSFRHDIPGTVVAVDLVMSWTPADGASTTLRLAFGPLEEFNGGYRMTDPQEVEGEGPLRLQVDGAGWDDGKYAIQAWWGGDIAHTPTGQEFHVEGTVTHLSDPVAPAVPDGRAVRVLQVEEDGVLSPAAGLSDGGMAGLWVLGGGLYPQSFEHDIPGTVIAADLTMTWTPATGASPTLRLFLGPVGADGRMRVEPEAEGESPLRLELDGLDWEDGTYALGAWWGGFVSHTPTGQEFHIEGTITYLE